MASARSSVRSNGRFSRRALDHAGDAAGMTLLAEKAEDAREIAGLETVDDVGRAQASLRHAHVERPVGAEGEAAFGLVELHGGDADVEHNAVGAFDVVRPTSRTAPAPAAACHPNAASRTRPAAMASGSRSMATTEAPVARMALV